MCYLKQKTNWFPRPISRGFKTGLSLLEVVVALAILSIIIVVFSSTLFGFRFANEAKNRNRAATVAEAGLEGLRALDFSLLADQTDGSFLGVLINQGVWEVAATSTAPSAPNILQEVRSSPTLGNISGLLILNPKIVSTSTIEVSLQWTPENLASGTPRVGLIMRARDITHGYFYSIDSDSIQFEKLDDAATSLFTQSGTYSPSSWHKLKAVALQNSFSLYYNDLLIGSVNDSTFSEGEIALFGEYALLSVDNITLSGDASVSKNFDSDDPETLPTDLKRVGFGDLPQGRGTLTIEDAFPGENNLKKATVRVYWTPPQGEKTLEATTLINN